MINLGISQNFGVSNFKLEDWGIGLILIQSSMGVLHFTLILKHLSETL